MAEPLRERSLTNRALMACVLMAAPSVALLATRTAAAQDAPEPVPPDRAPPPSEAPPAPAPSEAPPAPVPSESPPPPPAAPKGPAPAAVTLEETPSKPVQGPPGATAAFPAPAKPTAGFAEPPKATTERPPASTPASASAQSPEPLPDAPGYLPDHKRDEDDGRGVLGPFRIGLFVGGGLPSLLSFGGLIKITRYFGAGLNIGLIPAVKLSLYGDAELSYQHYELYGRLFPFGGGFFFGAGVGYATMSGTVKNTYDVTAFQSMVPNLPNPLSVVSEGSVKTLVLTPAVGLMHTFKSGFTVGIDAGAQIPIAPSAVHFKTNVPASVPPMLVDQYVGPNDKKVQDTLDKVGRTILPTLSLRIGWLI